MKKIETITPNEIAAILRIHPFTVTRLAREGKLPAFSARGGSAPPKFVGGWRKGRRLLALSERPV